MKKILIGLIIACAIFPIGAFAQANLELKIGYDNTKEGFISDYLNYDFTNINMFVRYFNVSGVLERGEVAIGPTLHVNDNLVKLQFGWTTDKEIMMGCVVITNTWNGLVYVADGKLSTTDDMPTTVYQKLYLTLLSSDAGSLQSRTEMLTVTREVSFLRIGIEYQGILSKIFPVYGENSHIFIAPFYDPINGVVGGQVGVRITL